MKSFLISLITALVTALLVMQFAGHDSGAKAESKMNRAYERVMKTRTLRCAYAMWPPQTFVKDPNNGTFSGFVPAYLEIMAKNLNLKIEYTEETGYGAQVIEGLKAGRFDAFCTGMNQNAQRGQHVLFTNPIFYNPIYAYVRTDDHRFDKDWSIANAPQYTLSIMDGEGTDAIAKNNMPKAKTFALPQNSEMSLLYSNVAQGKADIIFSDVPQAEGFMQNNPGKLRRANDKEIITYTIGMAVDNNEPKLQAMLNTALLDLQAAGHVKRAIAEYGASDGAKTPGFFYAQ
ncbi:MAG TPA: transporter substrate-binding domain-containing protein [Alphaproteobacteria bacterium]